MAGAYAQSLRIRLFIEGIEVPVISAQIQCAPNSPAVGVIQIPPLAAATKFYPRSTVHLFFLDIYRNHASLKATKPNTDEQQGMSNPSVRDRVQGKKGTAEDTYDVEGVVNADMDLDNDNWKLLFGGEIVGFTWTKSESQRSLMLQCEDWSNYWDYAFQADNTDIFGPGIKAVFSGASTNLFTDFLSSKGSAITGIVASGKCNTFPKLKGLAAGIIRLLEAIGGSYYSYPRGDHNKPAKKYAGSNIFFSYNELRLHLTQMIGTIEEDPTGVNILRRQGYGGMLDRLLGGQGGQTSIRQAINALTRVMFYEIYPQCCPYYRPGLAGEVTGTSSVKLKDHPVFGILYTYAVAASESLKESVSLFQSGTFDAATELNRFSAVGKQLRQARVQVRNMPDEVAKGFSVSYKSVSDAVVLLKSLRTSGVRSKDLSTSAKSTAKRAAQIATKLQSAVDVLDKLSGSTVLLGGGSERQPAQLYQQVFRPDIWFGAPPRCNVLFPESYNQLDYQRMFLQEPTRFMLKTNDEFFGEDELFDSFYFAPKGRTVKGSKLDLRSVLKHDLLAHERFTGILPIFEKMGEFNVFASSADRQDKRQGIQKVGLAQRSANFLYFRHRFNARRMSVSGKFNPYIAVGFPGLVIDRYVDRAALDRYNAIRREYNAQTASGQSYPELDIGSLLGTNFLGNFTEVVHNVSAQSNAQSSTSITLSFPRQPDENVEFLGSIPEDLRVRRLMPGAGAVRSTDVGAIGQPATFTLGPNGGRITSVQDITQLRQGSELPMLLTGPRRESTNPPLVPIGEEVRVGHLGSNILVQETGGDPDKLIVFRAYRVTEEIPRYRREEALLPAEEYIRPGWYGSLWTNSKIGKAYQTLVGTGAITDPQTVQDFGRSSADLASESSQSAANTAQDATSADDPRNDAPAITDLQEGASVQQAVEFLQVTYSYIRQADLDVDEFIGAYIWRPIVAMPDIFGTHDLAYSANGEQVVRGIEGFHSRAIGPYEDLFGLVSAELEDVVGIKRGSTAAANIDTRKAKREQVEKYISQLLFSNAVLG